MSGPSTPFPSRLIDWPGIIAGATAAAGISFTLHAFAAGIGLSVASTAPTWRDASPFLTFLTGLYLVFVALCAFGFGGYIAGVMRTARGAVGREVEFHDGIHGLLTWALATLLTAVLALGAAGIAVPAMAPSGAAGTAQSVAGDNVIASELDELFRDSRDSANLAYHRAEAARILLKSSSHDGVPADDRAALGRIAASAAGLSQEVGSARADRAIDGSAKELQRARAAAVVQAFFIGAALLVGLAVAWFSSIEGGRDREEGRVHRWEWSGRRVRPISRAS